MKLAHSKEKYFTQTSEKVVKVEHFRQKKTNQKYTIRVEKIEHII